MSFSVSLFQANSVVGAFEQNAKAIEDALKVSGSSDLLVTSLGALSGINPKGFRTRAEFLIRERAAIKTLVPFVQKAAIIATSSALICFENSRARLVVAGELIDIAGMTLGVLVGVDGIQVEAADLKRRGAKTLLLFGNEPFTKGEREAKETFLLSIALALSLPLIYVNPVGGDDGVVYEGGSAVFNAKGEKILQLPIFSEGVSGVDLQSSPLPKSEPVGAMSNLYDALTLGLRDYVKKNGFREVQIGLSGGVDSALVATIAVDALGKENVHALMMPTNFTSDQSLEDAQTLAKNLGIDYVVRPISNLFEAYLQVLKDDFQGRQWDTTEENLQARIRGMLLMAYSNKFNRLLLATSNKSETAVGYCTMYGDTAGAYEVIADVYKSEVWELCRFRNAKEKKELIPTRIISRIPSAELRPNQADTDSLPEYSTLDRVIELYVEKKYPVSDIVKEGFDEEMVYRIVNMIHRAEFKRSQMPTISKVTKNAFDSKAWDFPLTAHFYCKETS